MTAIRNLTELLELDDVDGGSPPEDGQMIVWNGGLQKFQFVDPPTGGGGGEVTIYSTRPALMGASVSELDAHGPQDGELGVISVGGGFPDIHQEMLVYNAAAGKWVGESRNIISQTDQEYMGPGATTVDKYVGNPTVGGGFNQSGWTSGYIPYAGSLVLAGLTLQARISSLLQGQGGNAIVLTPYWYADGTDVAVAHLTPITLVPAAGSLGTGPVIQSPSDGTIVNKRTGWTDIALAVPGSGWAGKEIWCGLFARMTPAAGAGGNVIDTSVAIRWIGA